jgi:hypothetical protein
MIYFIISNDFKLHIFNHNFIYIGWFPLNVRLITFILFYEKKSTLITGGIDGVFTFDFKYVTIS